MQICFCLFFIKNKLKGMSTKEKNIYEFNNVENMISTLENWLDNKSNFVENLRFEINKI